MNDLIVADELLAEFAKQIYKDVENHINIHKEND